MGWIALLQPNAKLLVYLFGGEFGEKNSAVVFDSQRFKDIMVGTGPCVSRYIHELAATIFYLDFVGGRDFALQSFVSDFCVF